MIIITQIIDAELTRKQPLLVRFLHLFEDKQECPRIYDAYNGRQIDVFFDDLARIRFTQEERKNPEACIANIKEVQPMVLTLYDPETNRIKQILDLADVPAFRLYNGDNQSVKEERFNRLAFDRLDRVIDGHRILGNCFNKSKYAYTNKQAEEIIQRAQKAVDDLRKLYEGNKKS